MIILENLLQQKADLIRIISNLDVSIQKQYDELFAQDEEIQSEIQKLNQSKNLHWSAKGSIAKCLLLSTPITVKYANYLEQLSKYFQNHYINLDVKRQMLSTEIGPSIIIHRYATVYDEAEGRIIAEAKDFLTKDNGYERMDEEKMCRWVKQYIDEKNIIPMVVYIDNYGDISFFDLNKEIELWDKYKKQQQKEN